MRTNEDLMKEVEQLREGARKDDARFNTQIAEIQRLNDELNKSRKEIMILKDSLNSLLPLVQFYVKGDST